MRFQSAPSQCGPAAVVNALRCYGDRQREDRVAKYAGTTRDLGTSEGGIQQSISAFDYSHETIEERKYATAEKLLVLHLHRGNPVIILAEAGDHWVTAIGLLGQRVIIADSQNYAWNKAENGIHVIELGDNFREFWLPYNGKRFGIVVKREASKEE